MYMPMVVSSSPGMHQSVNTWSVPELAEVT